MKKGIYISLLLLLSGCYQDDSELVQSRNAAHRTSEISHVLRSLSAHYAEFDDLVDNSPCFSINFPYQISINSNLTTISQNSDLINLETEQNIEIVYPVNITFYNYEEHQAYNQTGFNLIKNTCAQDFDILFNSCLNIQYPITFREFNEVTESFDTYHLHSDRDVFIHLNTMHENDVYEINYPVTLTNANGNTLEVNSNPEFINIFYSALQDCE